MAGVDWDEELPEELVARWEKWSAELLQLSQVNIPRCLRHAEPTRVELHVFSDASYATAAYLVCQYETNRTTSRLIASKCRVAPHDFVTAWFNRFLPSSPPCNRMVQ